MINKQKGNEEKAHKLTKTMKINLLAFRRKRHSIVACVPDHLKRKNYLSFQVVWNTGYM